MNKYYPYWTAIFILTVIFGCDLNNKRDSKGSMNLEGTWKVTSVDEPSCKQCPANWPKRKFLNYQLNISDAFDFSKDELTYKPITVSRPVKYKYRFNDGNFELLGGDWVAHVGLKQIAADTLIITLGQSVLPDSGTVLENRNMYVTVSKE